MCIFKMFDSYNKANTKCKGFHIEFKNMMIFSSWPKEDLENVELFLLYKGFLD